MDVKERLRSWAVLIAVNALAVAAFATLGLTGQRALGYVLTGLALAGLVWHAWTRGFVETVAAQLLLAAAVFADYHDQHPVASGALLALTGAVLALLIIDQPVIAFVVERPRLRVANLPGYVPARATVLPPRWLYAANIAVVALAGLAALAGWPVGLLAVAVAVVVVATGVVGLQAVAQMLRGSLTERAFRVAIERYDPRFALHFSAPPDTEYHVTMWLPYLSRIGEPFVVILREPHSFEAIAAATGAPVVYCPSAPFIDQVVTDGMKACFYVNNGAMNTHMVRFNRLTHIQLLHGDSDKTSSFNPVTAMYDRVFVAGQAGIDRYAANGVLIPPEKFDIVGRPQVESIAVAGDEIRDVADKTVLYALTWVGLYTDQRYCSLPIAETIVAELLRRGVRVILRPHPYSARHPPSVRQIARLNQTLAEDRERTGRAHVFGDAATAVPLVDLINSADALVSDVGSIATDWLYTRKPFALTDMTGQPRDAFEAGFPLARAAYLIDRTASNLGTVLDELLDTDPLAVTRRLTRNYYLGDFPSERYADGFVEAARKYLR